MSRIILLLIFPLCCCSCSNRKFTPSSHVFGITPLPSASTNRFSTLEGNHFRIHPLELKVKIPPVLIAERKKFGQGYGFPEFFLFSTKDLSAIRGQPPSNLGSRFVNDLFSPDDCVAQIAGYTTSILIKFYVVAVPPELMARKFWTVNRPVFHEICKPWERSCFDYDFHGSDYAGTNRLDFYYQKFGDYFLVVVFEYTALGDRRIPEIKTAVLDSISW